MWNKLLNNSVVLFSKGDQPMYDVQAEYGVQPVYGVQRVDGNRPFALLLFLILIPVILIVGVLSIAKKKQFSKKEKCWAVTIVVGIYYAVLVGVALTMRYIFN